MAPDDPRWQRHQERGKELEYAGDRSGAEAAYRRAAELGGAEGASDLGVLLYERGAVADAEVALRQADAGGSAVGAYRLGVLLHDRRDRAAAAAYRRAVARGYAPAAYNLGSMLEREDVTAAVMAYEQAAQDAANPQLAAQARTRLARLRGTAPSSPRHVVTGAGASVRLAVQAAARGDSLQAESTFRAIMHRGDLEASASAGFNLGLLLEGNGNPLGARAAYQHAVDGGQPEFGPMAALNLSVLTEDDDVACERLLNQALTSARSDVVAKAGLMLGSLLWRRRDVPGAIAAARRAVDTGHRPEADEATLLTGALLRVQGDDAGAIRCFAAVAERGDPGLREQARELWGAIAAG